MKMSQRRRQKDQQSQEGNMKAEVGGAILRANHRAQRQNNSGRRAAAYTGAVSSRKEVHRTISLNAEPLFDNRPPPPPPTPPPVMDV